MQAMSAEIGAPVGFILLRSSFRMPPPASPRARPLSPRLHSHDAGRIGLPTVGGAQVCRAGSVGPAATLGLGQPLTSGGLKCPRSRRREPSRCIPWLLHPLIATCSALPTVGGARMAALGDRHGNISSLRWDQVNSRDRTAPAVVGLGGGPRPGPALPLHLLPRRQPRRGIAPKRIFA